MATCIDCGEVIVVDDDRWITIEGTLFCVLSRADGRHIPAVRFPRQRVGSFD